MQTAQLFGLFANPVGHSLSPLMHNTAFRHLGIRAFYHAFEVKADQLAQAVDAVRILQLKGINISIPHKERIIPFLDEVDTEARLIGAVNTVINQDQKLIGYNTDGIGYVESLIRETDVQLESSRIMIIGAGGAAKAIGVYLLKYGCPSLTVVNRTLSRAQELVEQLSLYAEQQPTQIQLHACTLKQANQELNAYDVIINTTPCGMWPNVEEQPLQLEGMNTDTIVSDIVYNPLKTRFLKDAEQRGATIHGGVGMFVQQGAAAFELFTGHRAPVDVMYQCVLNKLEQEQEEASC